MTADPDRNGVSSGRHPAEVGVEAVSKVYGGQAAVQPTSFSVAAGSMATILGPSGSGKTTLLKIIAGFEQPSSGRVVIAGRDVTASPPYRRNIGFVFQNYALFPHLSVAENLAYPLRLRGMPGPAIKAAVGDALELVRLAEFGDRRPGDLSGGQQQRVALARAVIFRPPVLLMDEPMAALDRSLREEMQLEIRRLQRRLNITTVAVTHDQSEALVMSDQVIVLDRGAVQQIGSPSDVYHRPRNAFVARFIGESNTFRVRVDRQGQDRVAYSDIVGPISVPAGDAIGPGDALCLVRPEVVSISETPAGTCTFQARLRDSIFSGASLTLNLSLPDGRPFYAKVPARKISSVPRLDSIVTVSWPAEEVSFVPLG